RRLDDATAAKSYRSLPTFGVAAFAPAGFIVAGAGTGRRAAVDECVFAGAAVADGLALWQRSVFHTHDVADSTDPFCHGDSRTLAVQKIRDVQFIDPFVRDRPHWRPACPAAGDGWNQLVAARLYSRAATGSGIPDGRTYGRHGLADH